MTVEGESQCYRAKREYRRSRPISLRFGCRDDRSEFQVDRWPKDRLSVRSDRQRRDLDLFLRGVRDLARQSLSTVATLEQKGWPLVTLAVSPDGRYAVWDQIDDLVCDIMLVENFR